VQFPRSLAPTTADVLLLAGQAVHAVVWLWVAYVPIPQAAHVLEARAPDAVENVPAAQLVHGCVRFVLDAVGLGKIRISEYQGM